MVDPHPGSLYTIRGGGLATRLYTSLNLAALHSKRSPSSEDPPLNDPPHLPSTFVSVYRADSKVTVVLSNVTDSSSSTSVSLSISIISSVMDSIFSWPIKVLTMTLGRARQVF